MARGSHALDKGLKRRLMHFGRQVMFRDVLDGRWGTSSTPRAEKFQISQLDLIGLRQSLKSHETASLCHLIFFPAVPCRTERSRENGQAHGQIYDACETVCCSVMVRQERLCGLGNFGYPLTHDLPNYIC